MVRMAAERVSGKVDDQFWRDRGEKKALLVREVVSAQAV